MYPNNFSALVTFQVLSSHMWLEATALYTADLGVGEDLRMGVLYRKCKSRKGLKMGPWLMPTEMMGNQLKTEKRRHFQKSSEK